MSTVTLLGNLSPANRTGEAGGQGSPPLHSRYGLLLLVLMASYVLSAFVSGRWVAAVQTGLFLGVSLIAFQAERVKRRTARLVAGVIVAGSVVAVVLLLNKSDVGSELAYSWSALMLLFAAAMIVRRVLEWPEVSLRSIYGAVSAYIIIGLMFAAIYAAINQFSAGEFFVQVSMPSLKTIQYFSFTTLTTLGYGDYTARLSGGQAIAVMEAMLGQIFLATLVARLVSAYRRTGRMEQAGAAPPASPAQLTSSGNQAGPAQPASPGHDPAQGETPGRLTPRARARQARRARLRPG